MTTKMMRRIVFVSFCVFCVVVSVVAQITSDHLRDLTFRPIGPAGMSGRISDLDVDPTNPHIIYVATASGGVWKSTSGGIEWEPIFDAYGPQSIGDVTISLADPNVVWVGTGENTNRNSVAWGDGVYLSTDGGRTWRNVGLRETQQIARIVTHPADSKIAWVAAIGPLWGPSEHRGVYKTIDGGQTWEKVLYVDENTGASDLVIDPTNPDILYAGMYERRRYPWTFRSGGPNGGIFKSVDGGKTWRKLTKGLPTGDTGKIGLTIYPQNPKILYAIIEAQGDQRGIYRSDDGGESWERRGNHQTRPFYYHEITVDPNDENRVYSVSTQLMLSTDGGRTWTAMRNAIHVDYHAVWVNPKDSNHIWVGNDGGAAVSYDRGRTWRHAPLPVSQFYAICVDMAVPYHVYGGLQDNGSWGGPSLSRNRAGIGNWEWYRVGGGDGFHVQVNWLDNVTIYAESQGGALIRRNKKTGESRSLRPLLPPAPQGSRYRFNWSSPIVMSPHNPMIIWFGGNYLFKTVDGGNTWQRVSPDLTTNNPEKQRPMAGLTQENTGAETHCTIITISESPLKPDVVWVGTDDGLVQLTLDGGVTWTNVTDNIQGVPRNTWVSRVTASKFRLERCYVSFDGHRTNDMKPYVFVTEDFGKTWANITSNLPDGHPVYVIKEDPYNENLLYAGTEFGLFISLDRGKTWISWRNNLPMVAVHDLVVHSRDRELVLGTHGRGIWIAPVEGLQGLTPENMEKDFVLFEPVTAYQWVADTTIGYGDGQGWFYGQNPPFGARISYYLKSDVEELRLEVFDADGRTLQTFPNAPKTAGVHVIYWNLRASAPGGGPGRGGGQQFQQAGLVPPGTYAVRLEVKGLGQTVKLVVKPDPQVES